MKIRIIAFLIILPSIAFGQLKTKVELGSPSKSKSQVYLKEIVNAHNSASYTVQFHYITNDMAKKSSYSSITIEKFGKDLVRLNTITHKLKMNKKNMHFVKLYAENEKLVLLSMYKNKKAKMYELYSRTVNTETLELNNDQTKNLSSPAAKMFGQHYYVDLENFKIIFSPNKKKRMIVSTLPSNKIKIDVFSD